MDTSRNTPDPSSARGVALVQVMVFSMLLLLLATGLVRMMFGTHSMVARVRSSDFDHAVIDACKARLDAMWDGTSCAVGQPTSCSITQTVPGGSATANVTTNCGAPGTNPIIFRVTWSPYAP